jgi:putative protease
MKQIFMIMEMDWRLAKGGNMEIILMPKDNNEIKNTINLVDGYLIGIKDFSVNIPYDASFEEIEYIKKTGKKVFIALNKNMHNKDIEKLSEYLVLLDNLNVDGVLFYDISLINLRKKLELKIKLIFGQEHMSNNYLTSDFWYEHGAQMQLVSPELTKEEIKEMVDDGMSETMVMMFGYLPMFVSKRHLVRNYLDFFNTKSNDELFYLSHNNDLYPTIDNKLGTLVFSSKIFNGIKEIKEINPDYALLNTFLISEEDVVWILNKYYEMNDHNKEIIDKEIMSKFDADYGFLYKDTIYKVKP